MNRAERKDALRLVYAARRAGDVDALLNTVKRESDPLVKTGAMRALGLLGEPSAVEPLRRVALTSKDAGNRIVAIRALARIGDVKVADDLYRLVVDERCPVGIRETAATAMLDLGDRRAVHFVAETVVDGRFGREDMRWGLKKLRSCHGVEAIPVLRGGGSRRLSMIDRLRARVLLRRLESASKR